MVGDSIKVDDTACPKPGQVFFMTFETMRLEQKSTD